MWCLDFSLRGLCCGARALSTQVLGVGSWALDNRLNVVAHGHRCPAAWDLPGPGTEPMSPASAGRFFTPELPGKP